MLKVPGFLLRRLYVRGSLRNTPGGFEFHLYNNLGSGYAKRLLPLEVDGKALPLEEAFFTVDGRTTSFAQVSEGKTTTVSVSGVYLPPGLHTVKMAFEVQGLGVLEFDFTDEVT